MVGDEEKPIRTNPAARALALLKAGCKEAAPINH